MMEDAAGIAPNRGDPHATLQFEGEHDGTQHFGAGAALAFRHAERGRDSRRCRVIARPPSVVVIERMTHGAVGIGCGRCGDFDATRNQGAVAATANLFGVFDGNTPDAGFL